MKLLISFLLLTIVQYTIQNILISEGDDPQDEYCARYEQNQCRFCYMSILFNGRCRNLSNENMIQHCLQYSDKKNCLFCQLNYYPNEEGKCERVKVDSCLQSDVQGNCRICKAGYLARDGKCNIQDKCTIQNCLEDCMTCQDGFVNKITQDEKGALIRCVEESTTPNCLNLKINSDKCNICKLNYYMNEIGQCIKSTKYDIDLIGSNTLIKFISSIIILLF